MLRDFEYVLHEVRSGYSSFGNFSSKKKRNVYSNPINSREVSIINGIKEFVIPLSRHDEIGIYRDNPMEFRRTQTIFYEALCFIDGGVLNCDAKGANTVHMVTSVSSIAVLLRTY